MVDRICKLPEKHSFFLFGARGTGKTTLLKDRFGIKEGAQPGLLYLDFLDPDQEESYSRNPNLLREQIQATPELYKRVIIDEVQKVPTILDVVQYLIEKYKKIQFVLTGSSARKLKHGGANLLGGRAFSFNLYPFSFLETPRSATLIDILSYGTLPKLFEYSEDADKVRFLKTYTQTYLKQEIQLEQLVRDIVSFREFLDFAAQANGEIINYSNIAIKSGIDEKTIARYFEILVDTLIGFFLEPFHESVRVRQSGKPKFFLFDCGIQRYLSQSTSVSLREGSSEYGRLFEQWIVCECFKLNSYLEKDYRFYYLRTKDGVEIDLIVQKPGKKNILIEIKSSSNILPEHTSHLRSIKDDMKHEEAWVICNEKKERVTEENIRILPWKDGLKKLFELS